MDKLIVLGIGIYIITKFKTNGTSYTLNNDNTYGYESIPLGVWENYYNELFGNEQETNIIEEIDEDWIDDDIFQPEGDSEIPGGTATDDDGTIIGDEEGYILGDDWNCMNAPQCCQFNDIFEPIWTCDDTDPCPEDKQCGNYCCSSNQYCGELLGEPSCITYPN